MGLKWGGAHGLRISLRSFPLTLPLRLTFGEVTTKHHPELDAAAQLNRQVRDVQQTLWVPGEDLRHVSFRCHLTGVQVLPIRPHACCHPSVGRNLPGWEGDAVGAPGRAQVLVVPFGCQRRRGTSATIHAPLATLVPQPCIVSSSSADEHGVK